VEQIESDAIRTLGMSISSSNYLSSQQVTDCDAYPGLSYGSYGCDGGWTDSAFKYVKNYGLETDLAYPYTSGSTSPYVAGTCAYSASKTLVGLTSYTLLSTESSMANWVLQTGPLSICLDASTWNSYKSGIMSSCGTSIDHCVQAVGLNTAASIPYWVVSL
jgi:Papain family cysteine protease